MTRRSADGAEIGVLMLDTAFTRYRGDIGNPATWNFPVRYQLVTGATPSNITALHRNSQYQQFAQAAGELCEQGVAAISTSCGFLSLYQRELADCCERPVATSALLQVPMVQMLLGTKKRVGVLTYDATALDGPYLDAVNVSHDIPIMGMPADGCFVRWIRDGDNSIGFPALRDEVLEVAREFIRQHSELGAIVCECTNLAPFSADLSSDTGLPVFDAVTLLNWLQAGMRPARFENHP